MTVRVVLVDDQALIRTGLKMILEGEDDIEVVGEASDGEQAISIARSLRPDVILMDVQMPRMDGLEATSRIVGEATVPSRIVILTTFERDDYVFEALRAGASGFLLKNSPSEELVHAVRVVAGGDALLAPSITRKVIEEFIARPQHRTNQKELERLTDREIEVLRLLATGKSNAELATPSSSGKAPSKPTSRTCSRSLGYATGCKHSYSPMTAVWSNPANTQSRRPRMKPVKHHVTHFYQTAEVNCGYTALATQLSHYGSDLTPKDIYLSVPRASLEGVELPGSFATQLAAWALGNGFMARLTTFDFLIIDLAWASLDDPALVSRLKAVRDSRHVASLGKALSRAYVDEYLRYLEAGGQLVIVPYVSSETIYEKLERGPLGVSVCTAPLYGHGRMSEALPGQEIPDDVNGTIGTHSLVVYGNTASGDFLLADPWRGMTQVPRDALICAMTAAEIEGDALCMEFWRRTDPTPS